VVSYNVYLINKNKEVSLEALSFAFEKSSNAEVLNSPKLTVTSISSSLNMPRETVKRKVLLLQNKNFLTINPNKTIQLGKKYTEIFPDFASGTTLDLARLLQRWDKKDIVRKFLKLKI
jgi:predicted transcriptional regulator